jgi:acyl carrier protein
LTKLGYSISIYLIKINLCSLPINATEHFSREGQMERSEIFRRIKETIAPSLVSERLGITKEMIVEGARFVEDLAADSLDQVELILKIDEEFGLEIPDDVMEKIKTVKDAIDYLEKVLP